MAEFIRGARVLVEVDTNKETYVLDLPEVELDEIEPAVREFLGAWLP